MSDPRHAGLVMAQCRKDLQAVQNMLEPERFDDAIFGFHAQQAAEKALKAWLSLRGVSYPPTHDLRALIRLLEVNGEAQAEIFRHLVDLNDYAVAYRYGPVVAGPLDREVTMNDVRTLVEHVKELLDPTNSDA